MHHDDVASRAEQDGRCPDEVEIEIGVERGIDRMRGHDLQQCVACIHGCLGDRPVPIFAACAGAVLSNELLAEAIRQP